MAGISMKYQKISKILRKNGFRRVRTKGDHVIFKREAGETLYIPYVDCNELLLEKIFKQFDIKY